MNTRKIAVIVGSLRKESYNLKTAKTLMGLTPKSLSLELVQIGDLPFYNEEFDAAPPEQYKSFRQKIQSSDGYLFITPEYNRSVPGVLKNAIDVGSRPYGKNSWDGKPGAIISVSISSLGGFGANHHLRQSLVFINVMTMAQPEAYIGNAQSLFDESGNMTSESTREFLKNYMIAFEKWIELHVKK